MKWLGKKQYGELTIEEAEAFLRERMDHLFEEHVPKIESALAPLIERLRSESGEAAP